MSRRRQAGKRVEIHQERQHRRRIQADPLPHSPSIPVCGFHADATPVPFFGMSPNVVDVIGTLMSLGKARKTNIGTRKDHLAPRSGRRRASHQSFLLDELGFSQKTGYHRSFRAHELIPLLTRQSEHDAQVAGLDQRGLRLASRRAYPVSPSGTGVGGRVGREYPQLSCRVPRRQSGLLSAPHPVLHPRWREDSRKAIRILSA